MTSHPYRRRAGTQKMNPRAKRCPGPSDRCAWCVACHQDEGPLRKLLVECRGTARVGIVLSVLSPKQE
jgi:hypothetical protein